MKNKRIELILEEVKNTDSVLDVGCASHDHIETHVWIHKLLCEKARRVVGVDTHLPKEGGAYNIVSANAESMELNEKFDLIIAGELIEHLSNPGEFFARTREHLKTGGRLILATPNPWDWTRFTRAVLRMPSTPVKDHVCWYDEWMIANLANRYGFKIERTEFVPRSPYGSTKGGIAIASEKIVCYISWLLYWIGFKRIASMNLLVKCTLDREKR